MIVLLDYLIIFVVDVCFIKVFEYKQLQLLVQN